MRRALGQPAFFRESQAHALALPVDEVLRAVAVEALLQVCVLVAVESFGVALVTRAVPIERIAHAGDAAVVAGNRVAGSVGPGRIVADRLAGVGRAGGNGNRNNNPGDQTSHASGSLGHIARSDYASVIQVPLLVHDFGRSVGAIRADDFRHAFVVPPLGGTLMPSARPVEHHVCCYTRSALRPPSLSPTPSDGVAVAAGWGKDGASVRAFL